MIKDIILIQKRELEAKFKEEYIERRTDCKKFDNDLIKVVIGPRRAGKSFFCINLLKKLGSFGYVNFDDERLLEVNNYDEILNYIDYYYQSPQNILFDEIQNLKNWELFVNRLHRSGRNVIITGSNSRLLSRELATHLTGRHFSIPIFPFSFKEYLKLTRVELTDIEKRTKLEEYILSGGFPEPLIKKINIKDYLSTLFDAVIFKDIVKRFNLRSAPSIDSLSKYLVSNIAKEFSYTNLAKVTGFKSPKTVEKYINYLEETFLFFTVKRFSYKVKEQISFNKKVYCIDNGFITSKAFKISEDYGMLYENAVAVSLKKKQVNGEIEFYFWKSRYNEEVDFVIKDGTKIKEIIQVCYNIDNIETMEREKRALLRASKELDCDNLIILNSSKEAEEVFQWFGEGIKIRFIPFWKWFLEIV